MEKQLSIGESHVRIMGTIPGFVADGARVQAALNEGSMECIALGIPPEDLSALHHLAEGATIAAPGPKLSNAATPAVGAPGTEAILGSGQNDILYAPTEADFEALDPTQARFLELLGRFGETRVPSPDLEVAFAWAKANDRRIEALDLDDEAHAQMYISNNNFRHVLKSGRILKRIVKQNFESSKDPHEFACAWDNYINDMPSLQAVEGAREDHMAAQLKQLAKGHSTILAIIPAPRFAGVVERLARKD